jgi:hypothetical protein
MGQAGLVKNKPNEQTRSKFTGSQYQELMKLQEPRLKSFTTFGTGLGKDK